MQRIPSILQPSDKRVEVVTQESLTMGLYRCRQREKSAVRPYEGMFMGYLNTTLSQSANVQHVSPPFPDALMRAVWGCFEETFNTNKYLSGPIYVELENSHRTRKRGHNEIHIAHYT